MRGTSPVPRGRSGAGQPVGRPAMAYLVYLLPFPAIVEGMKGSAGMLFIPGCIEQYEGGARCQNGSTAHQPAAAGGIKGGFTILAGYCGRNKQEKREAPILHRPNVRTLNFAWKRK